MQAQRNRQILSGNLGIIGILLLGMILASPLASAEEEVYPPEVEYEPPIRQFSLFASGQDRLSPELLEQAESFTHNFPAGFLSFASEGPTLTTPSFVRAAPVGSESWNFSLWATGNGAVDIDLQLFLDGTEIDQVNSGGVTLSEEAQRVDFDGGNLPENITLDQTLSVKWTVNSQALVGTQSDCTIHWSSEATPTNLTINAGTYQVDSPYLISEGIPYRGDGENYSRTDVTWGVQIRWAIGEEQIEDGTLKLIFTDGGKQHILDPTTEGVKSDSGIYTWEIEDWGDGVILSAAVSLNDSSGHLIEGIESNFLMDEKGPSIVSSSMMKLFYWLTFPAFIIIGGWLTGRYKSLKIIGEELGVGPTHEDDLPRMLVIGAFLVVGSLNALVLYSYHSRQLGASEDLVMLHTGLLALSYGISGPIWGAIADKWGRRKRMLTITIGGAAILMIPMPWLPLNIFIITTLVQSILFGSARIAFAIGTEWYPDNKGEFIGLLYAVVSFFAAMGALMGGFIYNNLESRGPTTSLLGVVILTVPVLGIASWLVQKLEGEEFEKPIWQLRGEEKEFSSPKSFTEKLEVFTGLFKFESKWPLLVFLSVLLVAMPRGAVVLTSLRYFEVVGFDVDFSSLLEAWAVLAVLILYAVIGKVCDALGAERVLLWSALTYGGLWSIFSIGLPPMLAVMIFIVPIYPMLLVSNDSLLARFTTEKERNRGIGMAGAVAFAGQSLGIALGYLLMGMFLGQGMGDIDAYHATYRVNIILWIIAISSTFWLAKQIRNDSSPIDAEIAPKK